MLLACPLVLVVVLAVAPLIISMLHDGEEEVLLLFASSFLHVLVVRASHAHLLIVPGAAQKCMM